MHVRCDGEKVPEAGLVGYSLTFVVVLPFISAIAGMFVRHVDCCHHRVAVKPVLRLATRGIS
jgi:hypothetical protein